MCLRLPDTDGVDLIRTLKAADASTTIVAFSASLEAEPAARAAGADWFVLKPDSDTLRHVLACHRAAKR
jgi:CheY-like chemotaxis protein